MSRLLSYLASISRKRTILALALILVALPAAYYLVCLHPIGADRFEWWSEAIRHAPTPLVRFSTDLKNPVEGWEKELYAELESGAIDRRQVADQLAKRYDISISEGDLYAWISRMTIYNNFLHFFGAWIYAPDIPAWVRVVWERYVESAILLGLASSIVLVAWRRSPDRIGKHLPFLAIFVAGAAVRIYLLTRFSIPPSARDYALGWALTSGYPLYSQIFYCEPPVYPNVAGFVYLITGGSAFWVGAVQVLCNLVVILFAYLATWHLAGRGAALITSALLTLTPMMPDGLGFNTLELPYFAFVMVSSYLLLYYDKTGGRKYLVLAGMTASLAVLTKQLAIASVSVLFIYLLLRRDLKSLRDSLSIYMASFVLPALCIFAYPLSTILSQTVSLPLSAYTSPIPLQEHVDRLLSVLRGDYFLTITGFIGGGYLVYRGISDRRRTFLLFPMLLAASLIFLLFVLPYIDPHHCVFITGYLGVGSGALLGRLGVFLQSLKSTSQLSRVARNIVFGCLILWVAVNVANQAMAEWVAEPYRDQATRYILQYTNPGDFVVAPLYTDRILSTGRHPIPEIAWDISPEVGIPPLIYETYRVKLLILEDITGRHGEGDYIRSHYYQVATIVMGGRDPTYSFVFVRSATFG